MSHLEVVQRLLLAAAIGGVIGAERELRQKTAGFRTNILIAMGAATFTIVSLELGGSGAERTRIAANIVTGIGFLGAGAILRTNAGIQGVTTAATVWVNAALSLAAGGGLYHLAMIGTVITMAVLLILSPIEAAFDRRLTGRTGRPSSGPSSDGPTVS